MEANICDVNHLDADVLLPPRKRLLAGFKRQNIDGDSNVQAPNFASSPSSSSTSSSSEFNMHLNNMLSSHMKYANLSPEEMAEASRSKANAAVKAAKAARAAAEEKAAIAAKAVAAAKSALDLVASFSEEATSKERCLRKNKLKKHVPVQLLYKKHQPVENYKTDEELARRLHRAMNSSPRISKNPSSSDWKAQKYKRLKSSPNSERSRVSNGGIPLGGNPPSVCNGHTVIGKLDSESSSREVYSIKTDDKAPNYEKAVQFERDDREAESSYAKEKIAEDRCSPGKKRGRVKLKKLPLSICTFRDRTNPKEDTVTRSSQLTEMMGNPTAVNVPFFPAEPSAEIVMPIEATPTWKCQEFRAPACVKQSKVMQS